MKNFLKIKVFLIIIILIQLSKQQGLLPRLDTTISKLTFLTAGQYITSPLGQFLIKLERNDCNITIHQFDRKGLGYFQVDSYINNQTQACKYLKIQNGAIVTDNKQQYAALDSSDFLITTLTIDDNGNIRLIGVKQRQNQSTIAYSEEQIIYSIPKDKIKQKNIITASSFILKNYTQSYTNDNGWKFQIANNQLKISKSTQLTETFSLENIYLDRSGIYDFKGRTIPYAFFNNALLFPRAAWNQTYLQAKAPYTIQFDTHWPVVRIYDQQRYIIAQYVFKNQNKFLPNIICPPQTFKLHDQCITECPFPYYKKIEQKNGQCVLTCQQGSYINQTQRQCYKTYKESLIKIYRNTFIKQCQYQWTPYFYGCNCSNLFQFYDSKNTKSCVSKCPSQTFPYFGLCLRCDLPCLQCQKDTQKRRFLACTKCYPGYQLNNGICKRMIFPCQSNCLLCKSATECIECSPFYSLKNGDCVLSCAPDMKQITFNINGSTCIPIAQKTQSKCYTGCMQCIGQTCQSCMNNYIFVITPLSVTCKLKTLPYSCTGDDYIFQPGRQICYVKNINQLFMGKCKSKITNCLICSINKTDQCQLCQIGYYLHDKKCVQECPDNFLALGNVCLELITNCKQIAYQIKQLFTNVTLEIVTKSQSHKNYIAYGRQPSNEIGGFSIETKQFLLQQDMSNASVQTYYKGFQKICIICKKGYGLTNDRKGCKPCPKECKLCFFAGQEYCFKPTLKCTFLDENNKCLQSCPVGKYPLIVNGKARCFPSQLVSTQDYLKIDSSSYPQRDGSKIYYFVFQMPIIKNQNLQSSLIPNTPNNFQNRLLVQSDNKQFNLLDNQYFKIDKTQKSLVTISFQSTLKQYVSIKKSILVNAVYGADILQTHNQWITEWLAKIGYVLSCIIIILHCIYIGNKLIYKVDNLIIFCQTVYFFSLVKLLVGNTLAQFYHGWYWMHLGFFPNYFESFVPIQYEQPQTPLPYKLSILDGNFLRNLGHVFSFLITFIVVLTVVSFITFLLKIIFKTEEFFYIKTITNSLIGAYQFLSMIIFYFSLSQLIYGQKYPESQQNFNHINKILAIIFICLTVLYMSVRFFFNKIAGLYMFKRLIIVLILIDAYQKDNYVALLILLQVFFSIIRYYIEEPRFRREKIYILFELLSFIAGYCLLFLVVNTAVNTFIITIIVFAMILFLISDLIEVYLQYQKSYYQVDIFGRKYQNQILQIQEQQQQEQQTQKQTKKQKIKKQKQIPKEQIPQSQRKMTNI